MIKLKYNLINLITGLFFLIGSYIALKNKNNENLINYSIALAFTVLIILLIVDIIPDAYNLFSSYNILWILSGTLIGLGILKLIEKLVPHHDHFKEKEHHNNHLNHIGTMTSVALIIHNLVEGMSIYGVASNDLKSGLIYAFGVGLHNIPFGIEITALYLNQEKSSKTYYFLALLSLSTFIGGLILYLFNGLLTNEILGLLLSITTGMILYIIFNELLIELKEKFNKYTIYGMLSGIVIMMIGVII